MIPGWAFLLTHLEKINVRLLWRDIFIIYAAQNAYGADSWFAR